MYSNNYLKISSMVTFNRPVNLAFVDEVSERVSLLLWENVHYITPGIIKEIMPKCLDKLSEIVRHDHPEMIQELDQKEHLNIDFAVRKLARRDATIEIDRSEFSFFQTGELSVILNNDKLPIFLFFNTRDNTSHPIIAAFEMIFNNRSEYNKEEFEQLLKDIQQDQKRAVVINEKLPGICSIIGIVKAFDDLGHDFEFIDLLKKYDSKMQPAYENLEGDFVPVAIN